MDVRLIAWIVWNYIRHWFTTSVRVSDWNSSRYRLYINDSFFCQLFIVELKFNFPGKDGANSFITKVFIVVVNRHECRSYLSNILTIHLKWARNNCDVNWQLPITQSRLLSGFAMVCDVTGARKQQWWLIHTLK